MKVSRHTMKTSVLMKRFLPYYRKYWGILGLDLVCAALTTLCDLALPLIVRNITDLAANNLALLTVQYVLRIGGVADRAVDLANARLEGIAGLYRAEWTSVMRGKLGLAGALLCYLWEFYITRSREALICFKAFLHNHWAGLSIFVGVVADYLLI